MLQLPSPDEGLVVSGVGNNWFGLGVRCCWSCVHIFTLQTKMCSQYLEVMGISNIIHKLDILLYYNLQSAMIR